MGSISCVLPILFLVVSLSISSTDGWGKLGHFMVCKITEKYLSENATRAVVDLLPPVAGGELAAVCSWADEVRFRYRWSSPLHYANTPGVCDFTVKRDCHNAKRTQNMCVVGAINNYTAQLRTYGKSSSGYNLTESLMFLAHFMGDIHQPLHVGFLDDEGGNTILVRWYRRKTNLHHGNWADDIVDWETCNRKTVTCAPQYASESIDLSCKYAYKDVEQNSTLTGICSRKKYLLFSIDISIYKRIAQAGLRLATLLNSIFDPSFNSINPGLQIA
ncbi:unnamed protein product [Spirodela intermedia]|uniref:Aspergillus nuclease S1 n=1 Tax=Spirodela intermedia TaxID=51605 RepID=A0A7I8J7E5_SPIIN|nr:unnamed protein product [Spirodela intermedia]CAA6665332.1 unnamed protein product [Spirodela intermedia]